MKDPRVPEETLNPTLNARDWIENHAEKITAEVRITEIEEKGENLEVLVEVTNHAGHKFPSAPAKGAEGGFPQGLGSQSVLATYEMHSKSELKADG